jgi:uncharacterized protein
MNAFVIDAFEFCRLKERREGEIPVADLPRLADESVDRSGAVRWALEGGSDMRGHPQLNLTVSGTLNLMCQRCLTPFAFEIESGATLVLAEDEGSADEIDAQLADETVEVVVGSHSFDVAQVVEDEALLTIPLSPKHDICPDLAVRNATPEVQKESPFAVLKKLKQ